MAENLIQNPGADTGDLSFWEIVLANGATVPISSPLASVTAPNSFRFQVLWLGGPGDAETGGMQQYFDTIQGFTYELRLWANGASADPTPPNVNPMRLWIDNKDDAFTNPLQYTFTEASYPGWRQVIIQFEAQASRCAIRFRPLPTNVGPPWRLEERAWYIDAMELPAIEAPVLLEGPKVTIGDLLDNAAFDAGDFSSSFRTSARRWLNAVRSHCATCGFWKQSLEAEAEIQVTGNATGIYALKDAASPTPNVYSFVAGDRLLNVTDNQPLINKDLRELQIIDPDLDHVGDPHWWADYGYNEDGEPLILLYPRPTITKTIKGPMYRQFADVGDNDDGLTVDPFFGNVSDWTHVFLEGLRYYQEQHENEVGTQRQWVRFENACKKKHIKNRLQLTGGQRLRSLRPQHSFKPSVMLADPSHYDNVEA